MTFIFYDTETTGKRAGFDQILQFAAILADDNLTIRDSFNICSRLLPYIVPSPARCWSMASVLLTSPRRRSRIST